MPAFEGINVSPTKQSNVQLPRKIDYWTERSLTETPDKVIPMCHYACRQQKHKYSILYINNINKNIRSY